MTKQRHTKTVFKTTFTTAALSSALLTLFGCAASHDTNTSTDTSANIKLAHSESQLVKAESQDIALPLTKLKNGLSLTLHYQTHADHSNTQSAYKDTHANNTSKDARANNKHKSYNDTHAININVKQHKGISLSNSEGKKHFIAGHYTLARAEVVESNSKQWVSLVVFNNNTQYIEVYRINAASLEVYQPQTQLTKGSEAICATTSSAGELQIVNIDATGTLNQYEFYNGRFLSLRDFAIGPGIKSCAINANTETLYLADEFAGVWQLDTDIESELAKTLIFHDQDVAIEGVATLSSTTVDGVDIAAWVSPDASGVWLKAPCLTKFVSLMNTANESNSATRQLKANNRSTSIQPEFVHLSLSEEGTHISLVVDDESGDVFSAELPSKLSAALLHRQCGTDFKATSPKENHMDKAYTDNSASQHANLTIKVKPDVETDPVENHGDAADDPAIWVNSHSASQSRIIGTDKKGALNSYDLAGKLVQSLPVGRVNNVDVGYKVSVAETKAQQSDTPLIDIAVASNRSNNSLSVVEIDKRGHMTQLGHISTTLNDIYGMCLFVSGGIAHVFANDTSGRFERYSVSIAPDKTVYGHLTQSFSLPSQPEGCVVDTKTSTAYLGEEGAGIWALDITTNSNQPQFIAEIEAPVEADVEGLALFNVDAQTYLIASSQGNNSYAIYHVHTENPEVLELMGLVQITADKAAQIDGVSETDGLDVTNANLGGRFTEGLWVVQDGRNVMPSETQNFKLVAGASLKDAIRKLANAKRERH
ncbi:phytase [Alteromonas macleodii]|uniref:Phytase n=1 Tax=Alteromonas macleodii TaxID=28108 RepID=A0A126PYU3_ALTMA|nr:phytase [Alteromonas macleodii]AMJ98194.1 phytase [Alteromonas macleodii]